MKYLYICIYLIKNNDMKLLMKRAFTVVLAAVLFPIVALLLEGAEAPLLVVSIQSP